MSLSLYRKYNRLADGSVTLYSEAPNVEQLHLCSGELLPGGLHSLMMSPTADGSSTLKPLILIAGSIS